MLSLLACSASKPSSQFRTLPHVKDSSQSCGSMAFFSTLNWNIFQISYWAYHWKKTISQLEVILAIHCCTSPNKTELYHNVATNFSIHTASIQSEKFPTLLFLSRLQVELDWRVNVVEIHIAFNMQHPHERNQHEVFHEWMSIQSIHSTSRNEEIQQF